ncbi:MAG: helix-turn-helix transcriptional regulator [Gammaproteobacteria bacterium]
MKPRSLNVDLEYYNDLVGEIYDAALEPDRWSKVLAIISNNLNTRSAILRGQDLNSKQVSAYVLHNLDSTYQQRYREHFVYIDSLVPAIAKQPVGTIEQTRSLMSESFFKSEFYNEFALPQGMEHSIGAVLMKRDSQLVVMGFHRDHRRGCFEAQELALLNMLLPHLQRALEVNRRLWLLDTRTEVKREILDQFSLGVILIDDAGKPIFLNKSAENVVSNGRVLTICKNTLRVSSIPETKELHRLIFEATRAKPPQSGSMAIPASGLAQPLSLMVTPVSKGKNNTFQLDTEVVSAVIFISCAQQAVDLSLDLLKQLYGLTPAEARLAVALANGDSLEAMAIRFSVSLNTIRTQLKSCYRKTGASRQNELVKLVLSAPDAWLNTTQC